MIWKNWRMNARELLLFSLAAIAGGGLFGMIVVAGVVQFSDTDSYVVIGSLIALFIWLAVEVFAGALSFEKQFSMAVAMGRTRKETFLCLYIVQMVNIWIGIAALAGFNALETTIDRMLYPDLFCEFNMMDRLITPRIIVIAGVLLPGVYVFLGMLLAKFQKKALWGIWVIWMVVSLLGSNIADAMADEPHGIFAGISGILRGIAGFVTGIGEYGQLALGLLFCLIMITIAGFALSKQEVTLV